MFWEPEIAQWQWGRRRGTTWEQNEGDRITGLGHWLDLGVRGGLRDDSTVTKDGDGSASRKKRRVRGKPLLMVHSVLCRWNFRCWWIAYFTPLLNALHHSAPTIPDPLRLSSLLGTLSAAFHSPAEWSPVVHLTCLCVVHATWCFLSPASPARALYTKVYVEYMGWTPGGYNRHNHSSGSCLYGCFCWQSI